LFCHIIGHLFMKTVVDRWVNCEMTNERLASRQ
jgi:hypothetical protein